MPKIYLSPAYHKWNPCAIAGCDETTHNNLYVDELEVFLKACGFEIKRGTRRVPKSKEDGNTLMIQAVKESNAWGADVHYISHTNAAPAKSAGTVRGYRPIIWKGNNPEGERLAAIMIKYRKEIYNQPVTLNKRSDLYELNTTNAVAYYEEHVFHDNYEDAKWFHDNLRAIARQTCKAFCEFFNIPYVEPYEDKPQVTYKVRKSWEDAKSQVGAYKILQNAIAKAKETECNVYDNTGALVWEYVPVEIEPPKEDNVLSEENITNEENTSITQDANIIIEFIKFIVKLIKSIWTKEE